MDEINTWNAEPSPYTVLEEPIIRLLMMRDGVDVTILKRLWPRPPRHDHAAQERPAR